MEYKVTKSFIDKYTLARVPEGSMYPCEDPERAAMLVKLGYISEPPEKPKKKRSR